MTKSKITDGSYIKAPPKIPTYVQKYIDELPVNFKPGDCVRPIPTKYWDITTPDLVVKGITKSVDGVAIHVHKEDWSGCSGSMGIRQEYLELTDEPTEKQKQISEQVLLEAAQYQESLQKIKEGRIREVFPFSTYSGEGTQDV